MISRIIAIGGSNTLEDLHQIIFRAYDREEEYLYEAQVGGKGPNDPDSRRYSLNRVFPDSRVGRTPAGDVSTTTIASLGLSVDQSFGYWFDFGDACWHQIDVTAIVDQTPPERYPKITHREGGSPPQYADFG
jgi:hypothetical protein